MRLLACGFRLCSWSRCTCDPHPKPRHAREGPFRCQHSSGRGALGPAPPLPAWGGTSNLPPERGRQTLSLACQLPPWHAPCSLASRPFASLPSRSRPRRDLPPTTQLGPHLWLPAAPTPHAAGSLPSPRPLPQFVSRGLLCSGSPFSVKIRRPWGVLLAPSCPVGGPQRWIIDLEFVGGAVAWPNIISRCCFMLGALGAGISENPLHRVDSKNFALVGLTDQAFKPRSLEIRMV